MVCVMAACLAAQGAGAAVETPTTQPQDPPSEIAKIPTLSLAIEEPESVYPQPSARQGDEGVNAGAVHFALNVSYLSRYIYRGVDQTPLGQRGENALQFDGQMEFDLQKLPHPFVGLFVNVFDHDPVSRFEEVRPYVGLRWTIKPLTVTGGYISYIFPSREKTQDTQEIFASLSLDDSRIWNTDQPLFSPYIYGAYDFDRYDGVYLETGIKHDFVIGDTGATLTPLADVAYVLDDRRFLTPGHTADSGWQHYEVGVVGSYSLNHAFNVGSRYGEWKVKGYLYYDEKLQKRIAADTRIWGGVGLSFEY